jgi:hypothetical protein
MSVAVLAAAWAFQIGTGYGGVVTDDALIYQSGERNRSVIRRLELDNGLQSTLYSAPNRRTAIDRMRAGGGRVAFSTVSRGVRILAMDAQGRNLEEVARGRDDGRGECGTAVRLLDMSSSGEVLYEHAEVRCATHRGRYTLRARDAAGTVRTLLSRPATRVFLGAEPPYRQLEGDQLITWGNRLVRVRELATGKVRRFVPPDRLTTYGEPAVHPDGRILLSEFRFMGRGRLPRQTITLVEASGASRVVHRRQGAYGEARFCDDRPVLHTVTRRGRVRLRALDPPVTVFDGVMRDSDLQASCDARHYVLLTVGSDRARGERAFVHELPLWVTSTPAPRLRAGRATAPARAW